MGMKGPQRYDVDDMPQVQCGKQDFFRWGQLRGAAAVLEMPRVIQGKDQEQYADSL